MIYVKLRQAIETYLIRYGRRHTYKTISQATELLVEKIGSSGPFEEISEGTLSAIARRPEYNPSVGKVNTLCCVLETTPQELVEYVPDELPRGTREKLANLAKSRGKKAPKKAKATAKKETRKKTKKPSKRKKR
jgi:hypothetical protein